MKYSTVKAQAYAIIIILAWSGCLYYSLAFEHSFLEGLILVVLQTFLSVGLFITAHDSMHGLITKSKPLNDFYGKLTLYLYAAFSFHKLKVSHMKHHKTPAKPEDPDYTNYENENFLLWFFSFMKNYYHLREYILMHGHVLFFMWVADWNYPKVLIYYALPSVLSALQLFYFGTYQPHRIGRGHTNRHSARSNNLPVWLSFITCYHFGYHFEHHEYPDTPWWALPEKRAYTLKEVSHA